MFFSPLVWLQINWATTSFLVMRSYAQVVRRHERERILQEPILAGPGPAAEVTRPYIWRDRILQPALSVISSHTYRRSRSSFSDEPYTFRPQSTFTSTSSVDREYANPFSDMRSAATHEPSRENDGNTIRVRPDSTIMGHSTRATSPTTWEDARDVAVFQGNPFSLQPEPPVPRVPQIDTNIPVLPSFAFDLASAGSSPSPERRRPPGLSLSPRTSQDSPPLAAASSSSIRSPTSFAFGHNVNDIDASASSNMTRRNKSHDWTQ